MVHFSILTTMCINSIAFNFKSILEYLGHTATIIYTLPANCVNSDDLYIIVYNRTGIIPKNFIIYQTEQSTSGTRHFDDFKHRMLHKAKAIWEFSVKNREIYNTTDFNKFYYMPMPAWSASSPQMPASLQTTDIKEQKTDYDILFYGGMNTRRENILNKLKRKYNIHVSPGVYEHMRDAFVSRCKIVINLHFYENASLEACRINEVLKCNRLVISEKPFNDDFNMNLYNDFVVYFDTITDDLSNVEQMYKQIDHYLQKDNYDAKIQVIKDTKFKLQNNSTFYVHKNLYSLGLCDDNIKYDVDIDKVYYVASTEHDLATSNMTLYPMIKDNADLSYYNLIWNAKRCDLECISIFMDDITIFNKIVYDKILLWNKKDNFKMFIEMI